MDSTNKTPGKLQTDHGQGQTNASTTVQQEYQSATKTGTVSKVVVQFVPDRNIWTPAKIVQCPTQDSRS